MSRVLATGYCVAMLLATALAFAITESAKTQLAPIYGTKVDKIFSPVCKPTNCQKRVADISFKLRRTQHIEAWIDHNGRRVATLLAGRTLPKGTVDLVFDGLSPKRQRLPDGSYIPVVRVGARTLTLPNQIELVTRPPRILATADPRGHPISPSGGGSHHAVRIAYRLDEPAHGILLVDGHQVEFTRRQKLRGVLVWNGDIGPRPQPPGPYLLSIAAQDAAGNRSQAVTVGVVTVRRAPTGSADFQPPPARAGLERARAGQRHDPRP
jgi:hypothetical protein